MSIDLGSGVTVRVAPPTVPAVRVSPPVSSTVAVLPVAGPAGPAGSTTQYVHVQTTPQSVVTVVHNLGRRPASVSLFSLDWSQHFDEFKVTHLDLVSLRISADIPTAFAALIS